MSEFIITPTNLDFLESIFRNPLTGKWTIPILTFNTKYINPYYGQIDPLNDDPRYQKKVVDHFYTRLTEKWLYKDPAFRKLLKYFTVEKNGDEGKVLLIVNPEKISKSNDNETYKKYIFRYIEKYFITKRLVDKVLRRYVKSTHLKWYDLFHNTDIIKDLLAHKIKKLILTTIYQIHDGQNIDTNNDTNKK